MTDRKPSDDAPGGAASPPPREATENAGSAPARDDTAENLQPGAEAVLATANNRLIRGRHGLFLANPVDIIIGRSMTAYGEFSEAEVHVLKQLVAPGAVIVEAGANIGAITVPLARAVGTGGIVYAFEPQPLVFQTLCANLALNDLVNVAAFNAGCGEAADRIEIIRMNPGIKQNFGGVRLADLTGKDTHFPVPIHRLDDVIDPPRLGLIKADVEGMELATLKGAAGLIARFRPFLYLELNPTEGPELIHYLRDIGYRCWRHFPPLYNPANFAGNAQNIFEGLVSHNILCVPAERNAVIDGLAPVEIPSKDGAE